MTEKLTDRELLELAAKAMGYEIVDGHEDRYYPARCKPDSKCPELLIKNVGVWRPIDDDGDALRLAVKLKLNVGVTDKDEDGYARAIVSRFVRSVQIREPLNDDPCAATRRAIVRAAAKIGRNEMKQCEPEAYKAKSACGYRCEVSGCGSYAFNLLREGVNQGNLCDTHYWENKYNVLNADYKALETDYDAIREAWWKAKDS